MTKGHCLCGAVAYTAGGDPNWVSHCHCGSCRRNSGAAVATFVSFPLSEFAVTKGALSDYESSPGVMRSFCNKCGSPMTYRSKNMPTEIHVFLGSLENPEEFPAQLQVFCAEKLPWLSIDDQLPKFDAIPGQ
jgi:hypothetical protein